MTCDMKYLVSLNKPQINVSFLEFVDHYYKFVSLWADKI